MAKYFEISRPDNPFCSERGFYGERGLMIWLMNHLPAQSWLELLQKAECANGKKLADIMGVRESNQVQRLVAINELNLGKDGFGSPDGAFYVEVKNATPLVQPVRWWIFVEAKEKTYDASYMNIEQAKELSAKHETGFNSSINGQLELRWRFTQALKAALNSQSSTGTPATLITEKLTKHRQFYKDVDIYYANRSEEKFIDSDYRRMSVAGKVREGNHILFEEYWSKSELNFGFIAITKEPGQRDSKSNPLKQPEYGLRLICDSNKNMWEEESVKQTFAWVDWELLELVAGNK